mmetsp:Transcript_44839/g.122640  ORF Transcript_44839/g.122640 Transcript_44839/m.122640 type:complete len:340 (-) Transcript_44839:912-1931(-)
MAAAVDATDDDGGNVGPLVALPSLHAMFPAVGAGYLAKALRENSYNADTVVMRMLDEVNADESATEGGAPLPCRAELTREQTLVHEGVETLRAGLAPFASDPDFDPEATPSLFSDMSLILSESGERVPVHRVVLAARSDLMRERLANTAETTTQSDAGSIVEGSNEACNVELDSSVTARGLRHALTLVYTGRVKVPQEDVPELSAAALALGLKASQKILTHLDAQEAHTLTRLHHPEAAASPNAGSNGAAAEEEDEAAAVVDMGTTFEDDDQDYGSGFGLFVNNPLFSDVSLRLSDERSFAGHRILLSAGNPFFAAILRPTLGMVGGLGEGAIDLPEQV